MGGVFLAESLSVIIQVLVYKYTKNFNGIGYRVFKMAPLHHHFELEYMNEEKVVQGFWLATLCLILIGVLFHPS